MGNINDKIVLYGGNTDVTEDPDDKMRKMACVNNKCRSDGRTRSQI